jgi:hypothetical protein
MDEKKLKEISERIYNILNPWEKCDTTPEEIAEETRKNPLDAINFLLDMLEE